MIEQFTNVYPLTKTIRFSLIPVGKTEDTFNSRRLLEQDKRRSEEYIVVKKLIDRYHKAYIERVLSNLQIVDIRDYAKLYYKTGKTKEDVEEMSSMEDSMRKIIAGALTSDKEYKELFKQEMIKDKLPAFLKDEAELESVKMFERFNTYFAGFYKNRENMYSTEAQTTAISNRCIGDNLPKFLDNCKAFLKVKEALENEAFLELNSNALEIYNIYATDIFSIDYFSFVLSQNGIDKYNFILGGFSTSEGKKVQGINEVINLYNQQVAGKDKSKRLPLMKPLYKQILSDRESMSFVPEQFESDDDLLISLNAFVSEIEAVTTNKIKSLFETFDSVNEEEVYIVNNIAVTDISNDVFKSWDVIQSAWNNEYSLTHKIGKNEEKFYEERKKEYKRIPSFSISELQRLGNEFCDGNSQASVIEYYKNSVSEAVTRICNCRENIKDVTKVPYSADVKLSNNTDAIGKIKDYLDSVKSLEHVIKPLLGSGKEENKDNVFYGEFSPLFETLSSIDRFYDKVRNYMTKKPYSDKKIKLNFENSHFMSGWAQDYDTKGALIFRDGEKYYLGIVENKLSKDMVEKLESNVSGPSIERVVYTFQKPDNKNTPRLFIRSKGTEFAPAVKKYDLPIESIIDAYDKGYYKTEFKKKNPELFRKSLTDIIDYFKLGFSKHESYQDFTFTWKPSEEYRDINEFYQDTISSCYKLSFKPVNRDILLNLVDQGAIYLFQIYNKDFSEYSHGQPNMHTMYFRMLFDNGNLENVVYKLNGEAEMFYREASIKDKERVIHPANNPIKNKNPENPKKNSTFEYDLIKDKRYTKRQFSLHIPITINFKAKGTTKINEAVRKAIRENPNQHVIGIDRGERNLIYISVINGCGEIVEQLSLNEIIGDNGYKVDYHDLLNRREIERDAARKSWGTVENIKELKEGYISQVVHKICELVVKYDAIIALEDLNSGFKNGRKKVEKQVYQKFENMLISKLNFLVDKKLLPEDEGGLLHAYQLTNRTDANYKGHQNGIIFYVPAWNTSKIDPVTGFVDLLKPKYSSVTEAKALVECFDDFRFNAKDNVFEIDIDYRKFSRGVTDFKKNWTICTNGERILTYRNKEKNNEWDNKKIELTNSFLELFNEYGVEYTSRLKDTVLTISDKDFWTKFIKLLSLTLQMRNSITGSIKPEDDYLISPVRGNDGSFYDSRDYLSGDAKLPTDADANGAYNIARKGLWAVEQIKSVSANEIDMINLSITNAIWLEYVQK